MKIDFARYLQDQTLEETIDVLDEILLILVKFTEEFGVDENLSHHYLTIRNLRDTFKTACQKKRNKGD